MIERKLTGFDFKVKKNEQLLIPLVFTLENNKYHGFVPGFVMKDIVNDNLDECKKMLTQYVESQVMKMAETNTKFPYFPEDSEILNDFKNITCITRIKFNIKNLLKDEEN